MKTVFSRYQNIAAGKFTAAQSDIDSENYNEDEWSGLNDVETALGALGIKIRSSVDTFRDFDDVMEEIASKWDTYSTVQQSGIATSLAGVRQRENVITIFENWDLVEKFEEISANAYGTAIEKMEAYSDGVEAARKRVQSAWEGFALVINESGVLETAFNALATAIENLHWIIISASIALAASNPIDTLATVSGALSKLGMVLSGSALKDGTMISAFSKQGMQNTRSALGSASEQGARMADAAFIAQKQSYFGDYLGNFRGGLTDEQYGGIAQFQDFLIGLQGEKRETITDSIKTMLTTFSSTDVKDSYDTLLSSLDDASAISILGVTTDETANSLKEVAKGALSNVVMQQKLGLQGDDLNDSMKAEAAARRLAAANLLQEIHDNTDDKGNYTGSNLTPEQARLLQQATANGASAQQITRGKAMAAGAIGTVATLGGTWAGRKVGGALAKKIGGEDFEGLGESIGTVLGVTIGKQAATGIFKWIAKGAVKAVGFIGRASIIGVVARILIAGWKTWVDAQVKKAQEKFKELKTTYDNQLSASTKSARYDELAEGVDRFGRNVSLTEEEYSEFLSTSNELAELFPELVVRTDEAGNSFLGTAGKVSKITDAINEMVDSSQKAADQQLLSDKVFGTAFKDAKKEYNAEGKESAQTFLQNEEANLAALQRKYDNLTKENYIGALTGKDREKAIESVRNDINTSKQLIEAYRQNVKDIENDQKSAVASLVDYNNAIMREDDALQSTLKGMSSETAILAKQAMSNVFSNLNLEDYGTDGQYRKEIEDISEAIANMYTAIPELTDLELERTGNAGEYFYNREKMLSEVWKYLGEDGAIDEKDKKILISLGFEFSDDLKKWVDAKNTVRTIKREFGFNDEDVENGINEVNLKQLSVEDVDKVYGYLKEGKIDLNSSMDTIVNMLYADRDVPQSIPLMEKYIETLEKEASKAKDTLNGMTLEDWKGMDEKELTEKFSNLPEAWRNGIEDIREAIEDGDLGEDEIQEKLNSLYQTFGSGILDAFSQLAQLHLSEAFSGSQLMDDIDGIVDSMGELQSALKAVAESYDMLRDAQDEQNKHGKLSLSTVVDMLATNMNYAQVLDFETDAETGKTTAIKLAANAQETMNKIQLDAIKESLSEAIAKNDLTIAEKEKQIALLNGEKIVDEGQKQAEDSITLANTLGKAGTFIAKVWAKATTWLNAFFSGDGLKSAAEQAENAANAISSWDDLSWVRKYASMTKDEKETEKGKLLKEKNDLIEKNKVYKATIDTTDETNIGSELRGYAKHNDEDDAKTYEEKIEALEGIYNKEWYLRKSLLDLENKSAESQDTYMGAAYYNKMREVYNLQLAHYKSMLPAGKAIADYSAEELGYLQKVQETENKINNLDDEQIEDKINILQLENMSYEALISAQQLLIESSDSYEELLERQKDYNNLLKEQLEYQKEIAEWQEEIADFGLEYESYTPDTKKYNALVQAKKQALENQLATVDKRIEQLKNPDDDMKIYAESLDGQKELREKYSERNTIYQKIASLPIDVLNHKLDVVDRAIDILEKSKPEEWDVYGSIQTYYDKNVAYLEDKAAKIKAMLKDTSKLTDEQIQDLVDQLNDATIGIKEAKLNLLEDQKAYKESQYDAIVSQVNEYIDDLNDAIDQIEKAYEDEVKPLEDINKELERQAELEDLLLAKKNAAKEKSRVALNMPSLKAR